MLREQCAKMEAAALAEGEGNIRAHSKYVRELNWLSF